MFRILLLLLSLALAVPVQAQRIVRAVADATVSAKPDEARITAGVVTRASTAEEAAAQNAAQVETMLTRLRAVLGASADLKTVAYSISPDYQHSGGVSTIVGYTASNSVQATTQDLSNLGRVIDAAVQGGANTVGGISFRIQDPEPLKAQALSAAAKKAKAHAEAIAAGLGAKVGAVTAAAEGSSVSIVNPRTDIMTGVAPATPIETGLVQVYATVTVEAELLP